MQPPRQPPGFQQGNQPAFAADLPQHARERLSSMRQHHFFTSDLSVNEFLLVKEVGFQPLGLVMGSSIFHVGFHPVRGISEELTTLTQALYHARELAMVRMEEEADALGADGIVAVRLTLTIHQWGSNVIEFLAIGTAVKNAAGEGTWRASNGKPFQSDLSGQDFWLLIRSGYRPVGFVMGNCVYYVNPKMVNAGWGWKSGELTNYTHALYDARELAIERLQDEAEEIGATGIVGVTVAERSHSYSATPWNVGNAALQTGEVLELFVIGTAVVPMGQADPTLKAELVLSANDEVRVTSEEGE
jgi:uncharacterized protein YbjQ (UPF0145 family)